MKEKAVVYTRVSSQKYLQKSSLITQKEYYTDYCERKDYELIELYADEGLSGTNVRREAFRKMLYDAGLDYSRNDNGYDWFSKSNRTPKFDILITKDVSRFARSSVQGQMIIKLLKDKGIDTIFENSGMSTLDENWKMNIGILFNIAENESANMSKRIKFAKTHNSRTGKYSPSRLPYAYIKNDQNEIVINEDQAETVKYIFNRYLEVGGSIISKELNEKGIKTSTGKMWSPDKVVRICSNSIYYGEAVTGKSCKNSVTDTKRIKTEVESHVKILNAVPKIIDVELFVEVNKIRVTRLNKNKRVGRRPAKNDSYNSKLTCSSCGSSFVRHTGYGGKQTYICQARRKGLGCSTRGISINKLNKFMNEIDLSIYLIDMGDIFYYKELVKRLDQQKRKLSETIIEINSQITMLEADNETTLQAFKKELKSSSQTVRKLLEADIEGNSMQINNLNNQLSQLNIESIDKIRLKVEEKKNVISEMAKVKSITIEEKFKLLKNVKVSDYELIYSFSLPSYEEEVDVFNKLFPMSPIATSIPFKPFTDNFKRDHKAAREFWESVEEENVK